MSLMWDTQTVRCALCKWNVPLGQLVNHMVYRHDVEREMLAVAPVEDRGGEPKEEA